MDDLLRVYRPALLGFLIRRLGLRVGEAEDLVQAFIVARVLEKNLLEQLDPLRGKLRSLLMKSLQRYAYDSLRLRRAEEQRLQQLAAMIDQEDLSGDAFGLEWARQVLRAALEQTRAECRDKGRDAEWRLLEARVLRPALLGIVSPSYEALAHQLGFRDVKQAENALVTGKRRLRRVIEEIVGQYAPLTDIGEEIADLMRIVGRSMAEPRSRVPPPSWEDAIEESSGQCLSSLFCAGRDSRHTPAQLGDSWVEALSHPLADSSTLTVGPRTVGDALNAARPSVEELLAVKNWARNPSSPGARSLPASVLEVVESSAVAVALVTCGELISGASRAALTTRFRRVADSIWAPEPLRDISRVAAGLLAEE